MYRRSRAFAAAITRLEHEPRSTVPPLPDKSRKVAKVNQFAELSTQAPAKKNRLDFGLAGSPHKVTIHNPAVRPAGFRPDTLDIFSYIF